MNMYLKYQIEDKSENLMMQRRLKNGFGATDEILSWIESTSDNILTKELKENIHVLYNALKHDNYKIRINNTISIIETIWSNYPALGPYNYLLMLNKAEFEREFYDKYRDHVCHKLMVFILGIYLYDQCQDIKNYIKIDYDGINDDEKTQKFKMEWAAASFYHDVGYLLENESASDGGQMWIRFKERLNSLTKAPLSQIYKYKDVISQSLEEKIVNEHMPSREISSPEKIGVIGRTDLLDKIKSYAYAAGLAIDADLNPFRGYYEFAQKNKPKNGRPKFIDHGIASSMIMLNVWCNFKERIREYIENSDKVDILKNIKISLQELSEHLADAESSICKAAGAIALHNIQKDLWEEKLLSENDINIERFNIRLESTGATPPSQSAPLAFLLRLCDTLQEWNRWDFSEPKDKAASDIIMDAEMCITVSDNRIYLYYLRDDLDFKHPEHYALSHFTKVKHNLCAYLQPNIIEKLIYWDFERGETKNVYYENSDDAPKKYRVKETLMQLVRNPGTVEVIGRTCFRWLGGDENLYETDRDAFYAQQHDLHKLILNVLDKGGKIKFFLPNLSNLFKDLSIDIDKRKKLMSHLAVSIDSYDKLSSQSKNRGITLSFLKNDFRTSMTRITRAGALDSLRVDLNTEFLSRDGGKPFLIFDFETIERRKSEKKVELFQDEFDFIIQGSTEIERYDEQHIKLLTEVKRLNKKFHHHSSVRKDSFFNLLPIATGAFLHEKEMGLIPELNHPVSIQMLITNKCSTKCIMCDHYKLHNGGRDELSIGEIGNIFSFIKEYGTKSIIISGGEPLCHPHFRTILTMAANTGLNIGLLTNGVKADGTSIDDNTAKIINDTCSWVQLSIDSLNQMTYQKIRGVDSLGAAMKSYEKLRISGGVNIEICFTIQKANHKEAVELSNNPGILPIRFKFAHGPDPGKKFLCDQKELTHLLRQVNKSSYNFSYLTEMIEEKYFTVSGLAQGEPLAERMGKYSNNKYTCKVLDITLKVDPFGDVYPCCFLFDDNNGDSEIRSDFRLGSFRNSETGKVNEFDTYKRGGYVLNPLREVWTGDLMKKYRNTTLPVEKRGCHYCTRHFYQNHMLNEVYRLLSKYYDEDKRSIEYIYLKSLGSSQGMWV